MKCSHLAMQFHRSQAKKHPRFERRGSDLHTDRAQVTMST